MPIFDAVTAGNWLIAGLIGLFFGAIGTYVTHHLQSKRDRASMQHELEKIRKEWKGDLSKQNQLNLQTQILPTVWTNLHDALGAINTAVQPLQTYSDTRVDDETLKEILDTSELLEYQKRVVMGSVDRNKTYQQFMRNNRFSNAHSMLNNFHNYRIKNRIYFDEELEKKLVAIDDKMNEMLLTGEIAHDPKFTEIGYMSKTLERREECIHLSDDIHALIRSRIQVDI